jgi:hypothetical protein
MWVRISTYISRFSRFSLGVEETVSGMGRKYGFEAFYNGTF